MNTIGLRHNPEKTSPYIDKMVSPDRLHEVLAAADFVVNALPFTDVTKHFLSAEEFAAMKRSAYLINIGRGSTIDETTLIDALNSNCVSRFHIQARAGRCCQEISSRIIALRITKIFRMHATKATFFSLPLLNKRS